MIHRPLKFILQNQVINLSKMRFLLLKSPRHEETIPELLSSLLLL